MKLLRLLLLLLIPGSATADEAQLPSPPAGHVFDLSNGIQRQDRTQLETELARLRDEHHLDVIVVNWDRALPPGHDLDGFAQHLGERWAREELWTIVLQGPDQDTSPAVAFEGRAIDALPETAVQSIRNAINRGMKDWTQSARLRSVALETAEELVYLRQSRKLGQLPAKDGVAPSPETVQAKSKGTLLIRITIGAMIGMLIFGVIIAVRLCIRSRRPAEMSFPPTRWRRRLNAPWCGGSDLVTTFTPPDPS